MTDQTPNNQQTDKSNLVFRPLGNYAMIAVALVAIIVTTAIMLDDKQASVEDQLAEIEREVQSMNAELALADHNAEVNTSSEQNKLEVSSNADTSEVVKSTASQNEQAVSPKITLAETATAESIETGITTQITSTEAPVAEVVTGVESATSSNLTPSNLTNGTTAIAMHHARKASSFDKALQVRQDAQQRAETLKTEAKARTDKQIAESEERVVTVKAENKQRISDNFTRISDLESQRLDAYRTEQDEKIARLRAQVDAQQKAIEALISNHNAQYELRAASIEQKRSHRQEVLNRI